MNNLDSANNNAENNDQAQTPSQGHSKIHFRCPCCTKLYASDPTQIYVENPEYTCSSCDTVFSISLMEALEQPEVTGTAVPVIEKKVETVELSNLGDSDEPAGAVLKTLKVENTAKKPAKENFVKLNEERSRQSLSFIWQDVLANYESRDLHNTFIKACRAENNIDFAIDQYSKLVSINAKDQIAVSFLKKIEVSTETDFMMKKAKKAEFFTTSFYITMAIIAMGILMILLGTVWMDNKNLTGLGIGLIFFTFAVRAFFQPRHLTD